MQKEWYVANTYSGHESKVKEKLQMRVNTMGMEEYIYRIIVPEQTEVEFKDGVQKEKIKKMFPGYILVEMMMTDEAWFVVRNTPGVTGFIGSSGKGEKPFPLTKEEVDNILSNMGLRRVEVDSNFKVDETIKIVGGPFAGMFAKVKEIDMDNQKLGVDIDLFGQETRVDLDFNEIDRI
jgi:transcriptional antiterminator NusG